MAYINLLPWREELRLKKNQEFLTVVVAIGLLAGAVVLAVLFFFNTKLKDQKEANQLITSENEKLEEALAEIKTLEQRRDEIVARMKVIQDLQGKRSIPVRFWDDLSGAVPEFLYLISIERKEDKLIIQGYADNPNIVSTFINNLNKSEWMDNSSVQYIGDLQDAKRLSPEEMAKLTKNLAKMFGADAKGQIPPEYEYVKFEITTDIQSPLTEEEKEKQAKEKGAGTAQNANPNNPESVITPAPSKDQQAGANTPQQAGTATEQATNAGQKAESPQGQKAESPQGQNGTAQNTNTVKETNVAEPIVIQQKATAPSVKNSTAQNANNQNGSATATTTEQVQANTQQNTGANATNTNANSNVSQNDNAKATTQPSQKESQTQPTNGEVNKKANLGDEENGEAQ